MAGAADMVDKILRGNKARRYSGRAADEVRVCHQPQGAKELGLVVPSTLLVRADEVIA